MLVHDGMRILTKATSTEDGTEGEKVDTETRKNTLLPCTRSQPHHPFHEWHPPVKVGVDRLGMPIDNVVSNLYKYRNTSVMSIPLVLDNVIRSNRVMLLLVWGLWLCCHRV